MFEAEYLSKFTSTPGYAYPVPDPDMDYVSERAEPSKSESMAFYCDTTFSLKKDLYSVLIETAGGNEFTILAKIIPAWGRRSVDDAGLLHSNGNSLSGELLRKMSIAGLIHWYFSYFNSSIFTNGQGLENTLTNVMASTKTKVSIINPETKICGPAARNYTPAKRETYKTYTELSWDVYIEKLDFCRGIGILGAIFLRLKIINEKINKKTINSEYALLSAIEKQKFNLVNIITSELCNIIQYNIVNWIYNIFWEKIVTFQNILFAIDMDIIDSNLLSKKSDSFNELIYMIYNTQISDDDIYSNILSKLNIHVSNISSASEHINYSISESLIKRFNLLFPVLDGGTRKYLKYKQKYIQLKNKLNNFSK